ncbi:MAG: AI-2E family transporter [Pigmentiphaga sp.]
MDVRLVFIALAAGAGLFLAYEIAGTLLLIFAGILLATVLDAAVVGLGRVLPIPRSVRLGMDTVVVMLLLIVGVVYGGYALATQLQTLATSAIEQVELLVELLSDHGIELLEPNGEGGMSVLEYMPSPELLFGHAQNAFGSTVTVLVNAIIVVFLGLFFASNPAGYRDGFVKLIAPDRRERVREVLTETGVALRWWIVGQLAMMVLVAVSMTAMLLLVGIPNAILLGVIAGLLNFIPYLGPVLAAVPVLLAAVPEGLTTFLLVVSLFVVIESIEGYLFTPLIQQRAVHLPAAWSLAALLVGGALFGGIGIALATPFLAVVRILVLRLYVEDGLERRGYGAGGIKSASSRE